MNDLKVLMVGNDHSVKGGITSVIQQLLVHDWTADDVKMKFIPTYIEANKISKMIFFFTAYKKIKEVLKNNKPDVVHIHMSYKGSFVRKYLIHKLCKKYHVKDIVHLHGSEFKKWYDKTSNIMKLLIRNFLREVSLVITLGNKWETIIKNIEPAANIIVVNNSIHIPDYRVQWRQPFQVLFLGVLIKRKGVSDLLKAIKLLKDSIKIDNVLFTIAGSGPEESNLKAECLELGINDIVRFVGWVDNEKKISLLRESQLFVLPSYNEGLPVALLEAISYGLPVVATDVGDISEAVFNGENGFLIKHGHIQQLYTSIRKIIDDKDLYIKMSKASRQIAENKFSDRDYYNKIKECYIQTLGI